MAYRMNKKSKELLTVFLALYNITPNIKSNIRSIFKQTFKNYKIFFTLDFPKKNDNDYNIKKFKEDSIYLKSLKRKLKKKNISIEIILRKKNFGPIENARKFIFENIKTNYLYVISQNDRIIDHNFFKDSINFLIKNKDCGMVSYKSAIIRNNKRIKDHKRNIINIGPPKKFFKINGINFLKYFKFLDYPNVYAANFYDFENIKKNGFFKFFPPKKIYDSYNCFWEEFESFIYFSLINKKIGLKNKISAFIYDEQNRASRSSIYRSGTIYHNRSVVFSRYLLLKKLNIKELKLSLILQLVLHWNHSPKKYYNGLNKYFKSLDYIMINIISLAFGSILFRLNYKIRTFSIRTLRSIFRYFFLKKLNNEN